MLKGRDSRECAADPQTTNTKPTRSALSPRSDKPKAIPIAPIVGLSFTMIGPPVLQRRQVIPFASITQARNVPPILCPLTAIVLGRTKQTAGSIFSGSTVSTCLFVKFPDVMIAGMIPQYLFGNTPHEFQYNSSGHSRYYTSEGTRQTLPAGKGFTP